MVFGEAIFNPLQWVFGVFDTSPQLIRGRCFDQTAITFEKGKNGRLGAVINCSKSFYGGKVTAPS